MIYQLPQLAYSYDALEPYIDAKTMKIHHTKHHQAYIDGLNRLLNAHPELALSDLHTLLGSYHAHSVELQGGIRNYGGGHDNHTRFWLSLRAPRVNNEPSAQFKKEVASACGVDHWDGVCERFSQAAQTVFGSGWAWLSLDARGKGVIHITHNQDSPVMEGYIPLLGIDVWEHAYYLHYQNRRAEYIAAWWNIINWEYVEEQWYMHRKLV